MFLVNGFADDESDERPRGRSELDREAKRIKLSTAVIHVDVSPSSSFAKGIYLKSLTILIS